MVPRGTRQTHAHRRYRWPYTGVAATFEGSSRMLAVSLADPRDPGQPVKLALFVFDAEFQRLSKAAERFLEWRVADLVDESLCHKERAPPPCVLLPHNAAAAGDGTGLSSKVCCSL